MGIVGDGASRLAGNGDQILKALLRESSCMWMSVNLTIKCIVSISCDFKIDTAYNAGLKCEWTVVSYVTAVKSSWNADKSKSI